MGLGPQKRNDLQSPFLPYRLKALPVQQIRPENKIPIFLQGQSSFYWKDAIYIQNKAPSSTSMKGTKMRSITGKSLKSGGVVK